MIDFMNTPDWNEEDKKWIKNRLEILNKHLGEFVNLKDDIVGVEKLDTILPYPKNVAILINSNCGSTGYFGSNCASDFGGIVPVIPVQTVPF